MPGERRYEPGPRRIAFDEIRAVAGPEIGEIKPGATVVPRSAYEPPGTSRAPCRTPAGMIACGTIHFAGSAPIMIIFPLPSGKRCSISTRSPG